MIISNNYNIQNTNYYNYTGNYHTKSKIKAPTFGYYRELYPKTGFSAATDFYHDYLALKKAVRTIEKNFPNGAAIIVHAGSNGEEAISIWSMLNNPEKYEIYSIDPFKDAIEYAKKGLFKVSLGIDGADGYLISDIKPKNSEEEEAKKYFKKCFNQNIRPVDRLIQSFPTKTRDLFWQLSQILVYKDSIKSKNDEDALFLLQTLNSLDLPHLKVLEMLKAEEEYKLKDEVKNNIHFLEGDIWNLADLKTEKPVGGILFRNGLYHLTQNDSNIECDPESIDILIDRRAILKKLISIIEKKLDMNGIFVLGNHLQEHLYFADIHTPKWDIYNRFLVNYCKTPLAFEAMKWNGHFTNIYEEDIVDTNQYITRIEHANKDYKDNLPFSSVQSTIWQKVK